MNVKYNFRLFKWQFNSLQIVGKAFSLYLTSPMSPSIPSFSPDSKNLIAFLLFLL